MNAECGEDRLNVSPSITRKAEKEVAHSHPNQAGRSLRCQAWTTCPPHTMYRFDTKHFFHPCTLPLAKMV